MKCHFITTVYHELYSLTNNYLLYFRGVILFAMTCGRLPYNDKSLKHLIEQTKKKVVFPEKLNLSAGKMNAHKTT